MSPPADNPFASHHIRPGAVPFLFPPGVTAAALVERLAACGWRGQVVGPHGSGKSTLLAALAGELERHGCDPLLVVLPAGMQRLPEGVADAVTRPGAGGRRPVLLLDGAERLWPWSRWRLGRRLRAGGWGLVAAAHWPLGLPTLYRTRATPELAERVVLHLAGGGPVRGELAARLRRRGGDLRAVLFDLYDDHERRRAGRA